MSGLETRRWFDPDLLLLGGHEVIERIKQDVCECRAEREIDAENRDGRTEQSV